ncbi:MAG: DUF1836 domain-containing protein [Eubacteriales bacterium]|jgi:hypothetical protein|nr:DUF1836 domain-containing protein [Eubacteriales bacterium]
MENIDKIIEWAQSVKETDIVNWEALPDLDLYMDQVLTYMDRQLSLFQKDEENKLLTSSMINNYVKDGLIPRPEKKKYSREHLASMLVICMLKQVLTMQNITRLQESEQDKKVLYEQFSVSQSKALHDVAERVLHTDRTPEEMHRLTIELSIEANARRITAENILAMMKEEKEQTGKHD